MAFDRILEEYEERKKKTLAQGGPEKIKRQHGKGWLTARERIDWLLDPDTFMEFGAFCTSDWPGMAEKTPADSLICGYGYINERRVAVIANDFTVLASTNAPVNLKKQVLFRAQVRRSGIPLIWLGEAGGARMPDVQSAKSIMACGFKGYRLKVMGRADDMITVKGVNVFAGAIHKTLQQFVPRVTGHMRVVKEDPSARLSSLVLRLEYGEGMADQLEELGKEIVQVMRSSLRISPRFEWVPPETLERPIRKPILFEKRY